MLILLAHANAIRAIIRFGNFHSGRWANQKSLLVDFCILVILAIFTAYHLHHIRPQVNIKWSVVHMLVALGHRLKSWDVYFHFNPPCPWEQREQKTENRSLHRPTRLTLASPPQYGQGLIALAIFQRLIQSPHQNFFPVFSKRRSASRTKM